MANQKQIAVIAHDMRSTFNVGSLLRTCDGLGVSRLWLTGYTPYPRKPRDRRLPHDASRQHEQIAKTALGAENASFWEQAEDARTVIGGLQQSGYKVYALEQAPDAIPLPSFRSLSEKIALLLGTEVTGIPDELIALCDGAIEIPMSGKKESFNVVQAAAMCLYHCRYFA